MYCFKANYYNVKKNREEFKTIKIDENVIDITEEEIYLQAMRIAYRETKENYFMAFNSLELIYC